MARATAVAARPGARLVLVLMVVLGLGLSGQPSTLGQVMDDHGDDRDHATAINLGDSTAGTIDPATDEDFFRFELTASTGVRILTSGNLDTVGQLQGSSGAVLHAARTYGERAPASEPGRPTHVVCIFADAGWKYLDSHLWTQDPAPHEDLEGTLWW